jgi:hypothetical protein
MKYFALLGLLFSLASCYHKPVNIGGFATTDRFCQNPTPNIDREPSSATIFCSKVLAASSVEVTDKNNLNKTSSEEARRVSLSLDQIRLQRLRSEKIDLDNLIDLLAPSVTQAPLKKISDFIQSIDPSITNSEIQTHLSSNDSVWSRLKSLAFKRKNIDELTLEELQERISELTPFMKIVLLEADLYINKRSWGANFGPTFLEHLLATANGNMIAVYINREETPLQSGINRTQLVRELLSLFALVTGSKFSEVDIASQLIAFAEPAKLPTILRDLLKSEPHSDVTKSFISQVLSQKIGSLLQLLPVTLEYKLNSRFPELWLEWTHRVLDEFVAAKGNSYLEALKILDQWHSENLNAGGTERQTLQYLKYTKPLRKRALDANSQAQVLGLYMDLIARTSSDTGRAVVLGMLAEIGPEGLKAYVGNDKHSTSRVIFLIKNQSFRKKYKDELLVLLKDYKAKLLAGKPSASEIALEKRIASAFPELRPSTINISQLLLASEIKDVTELNTAIQKNQDSIESDLKRALESVLQANAPPEFFADHPKPWNAYLKSIPAQIRAEQLWKLLEKNSSSMNRFTEIVSQLEPIEGVRDTIIRFIANMPQTTSADSKFTQAEVTKMFGGQRFGNFFPHLKDVKLEGAIRTKFIIAVRTDPQLMGLSLNKAWLRQALDNDSVREDIPQVFGFRPALQYDRLQTHINHGFSDPAYSTPAKQLRGLIVQGHYEKSGQTMMRALNQSRGQGQVETLAPALKSSIEAQLRSGILGKDSVLVQRLFTTNWALNADGSLIDNIRNRAIRIAEIRSDFYSLRVEIHNFPTHDTLLRVKEYRTLVPEDSRTISDLDFIIREIEQFLGTNEVSGGLSDLIGNRLTVSQSNRDILLGLLGPYENLPLVEQLQKTLELREKFAEIKQNSSSDSKRYEYLLGDQALSEAATVIFSKWLATAGELPLKEKLEGWKVGLKSLLKDDVISSPLAIEYEKALQTIVNDAKATELEKAELAMLVLKGLVDQVYFRIQDEFGFYDNAVMKVVKSAANPTPLKFVDNFMRSGMTFMFSKIVDMEARKIAIAKNIKHSIGAKEVQGVVEVYNSGETVGVLRLNRNAMELSKEDIAVFEQMPGESAAVSGFITVGVGARLSHLQLLSKSLKIPNVQVGKDMFENLQELDGKWVRFKADEDGRLTIEEASKENRIASSRHKIKVPKANHDVQEPISFIDLKDIPRAQLAGPKGVTLAKLYQDDRTKADVPDGVVLPFGFFEEYSVRTGLKPLLTLLGQVKLYNQNLIGILTAQIALKIERNPIPQEMLSKIKASVDSLESRTGNRLGYFFRSDTNVEDLPNFNGAGLNESVPNVPNELSAIDSAVRRVWISPYTEKSIFWRGEALGRKQVTLAEPSVVIMPTVQAQASGVIISRGGKIWEKANGRLSANFGIGSVVEAGRPVEEYTFELSEPVRLSASVSRTMPVAGPDGGLIYKEVAPGTAVLTSTQATQLNQLSQRVEQALGNQEHGWDIEWAVDQNGSMIILQARPNM